MESDSSFDNSSARISPEGVNLNNPMGLNKNDLLKMQKKKIVKVETTKWGQCLLCIPKHLLKVSIIVIIVSFLGMLSLINSDASLNDFLAFTNQEVIFFDIDVHPLFRYL